MKNEIEKIEPLIEIVDFHPYPAEKQTKKDFIFGTLHIYIIREALDIRGLPVTVHGKTACYVKLSYKKGWDEETGADVTYPIWNFGDQDYQRELNRQIKKLGKAYVLDKLKKQREELKKASQKKKEGIDSSTSKYKKNTSVV